ncbi:MAG: hypothetical protein GX270_10200 [Clostridiaceae bacterium]|nr:hypothetical protein [Clostridiaceae bacterium]
MDKKKIIVLTRELADRTSKSSVALTERILRSALKSSKDKRIQKMNFFHYLIIAADNIEAISGEINKKSKEEFIDLVKNVFRLEKRNGNDTENIAPEFKELDLEEWCYIVGWAKKLNTNKFCRSEKGDSLNNNNSNLVKFRDSGRGENTSKKKTKKKGFNTPFADINFDKLWNGEE